MDDINTQEDFENQAAVMVIVFSHKGEDRVLLTRRAQHMASHGGEVACPGGKWEPGDETLLCTAYRETHEELGIPPSLLAFKGELMPFFTRKGVLVKPFISHLIASPILQPCKFEIESTFWLPLDVLLNDERVITHVLHMGSKEYWAPVYEYKGYKVWGVTARILVAFVNNFYDAGISRSHTAPEVLYS